MTLKLSTEDYLSAQNIAKERVMLIDAGLTGPTFVTDKGISETRRQLMSMTLEEQVKLVPLADYPHRAESFYETVEKLAGGPIPDQILENVPL